MEVIYLSYQKSLLTPLGPYQHKRQQCQIGHRDFDEIEEGLSQYHSPLHCRAIHQDEIRTYGRC